MLFFLKLCCRDEVFRISLFVEGSWRALSVIILGCFIQWGYLKCFSLSVTLSCFHDWNLLTVKGSVSWILWKCFGVRDIYLSQGGWVFWVHFEYLLLVCLSAEIHTKVYVWMFTKSLPELGLVTDKMRSLLMYYIYFHDHILNKANTFPYHPTDFSSYKNATPVEVLNLCLSFRGIKDIRVTSTFSHQKWQSYKFVSFFLMYSNPIPLGCHLSRLLVILSPVLSFCVLGMGRWRRIYIYIYNSTYI